MSAAQDLSCKVRQPISLPGMGLLWSSLCHAMEDGRIRAPLIILKREAEFEARSEPKILSTRSLLGRTQWVFLAAVMEVSLVPLGPLDLLPWK